MPWPTAVVFLTSHADPAYEKLAFERGVLDFIDKPRGVEILAKRLRLAAKSGKPQGWSLVHRLQQVCY